MDGLPVLTLWEQALEILSPTRETYVQGKKKDTRKSFEESVDYVSKTVPPPKGRAQLVILRDNEAVIKISIKMRWPQLRYVPRTQRIDLDFVFERIHTDPGVFIKYINTKK